MSKSTYGIGTLILASTELEKLLGSLHFVAVLIEKRDGVTLYYVTKRRQIVGVCLYEGGARALYRFYAQENDDE